MALRYWVTGGTGNYNSTTNWSTTSGGASGASVPTTADDAIWDSNSGAGNVVINVASVAKSIDFSTFTGTVDFQNTLAVAGNMTLGTGMSFANTTGSPVLRVTAAGTLTSNGVVFPYDFSVAAANVTITLADDWECRNFTHDVSTSNPIINDNRFFINGDLTNLNTNRYLRGTTIFEMKGTGSISTSYSSAFFLVENLVINTTGTITISTNLSGITSTGVFTYTSGTVITAGITLYLRGTIYDFDGIIFENLYIPSFLTITLLSDLTYTDTLSTYSSNSSTIMNGSTVRHIGPSGGISNLIGSPGGSSGLIGTTTLSFEGSGAIDTGGNSGVISLPIVINTAGTYVPSTTFSINNSTFTYTSGTIDFSGSTLDLRQNNKTTTFNGIGSLAFNELLMGSSVNEPTVVLNDTMNIDFINCSLGQSSTTEFVHKFTGTHPFICNTFYFGGSHQNLELQHNLTYTINNVFRQYGSVSYSNYLLDPPRIPVLRSTLSGSKVNIKLEPGAIQELYYLEFKDVDATSGQTLWLYGALSTVTDCINVNTFTQPKPVGF